MVPILDRLDVNTAGGKRDVDAIHAIGNPAGAQTFPTPLTPSKD